METGMQATWTLIFTLPQFCGASAIAQADWPSRPIIIVTPYAPGASDISVRA